MTVVMIQNKILTPIFDEFSILGQGILGYSIHRILKMAPQSQGGGVINNPIFLALFLGVPNLSTPVFCKQSVPTE